MPTLIGILVAMAATLPGRVLAALGIGWVTYAGLSAIAGSVITAFQNAWGAIPSDVLGLLQLAGFGEAFGIVLGAVLARVALMSMARLGKV